MKAHADILRSSTLEALRELITGATPIADVKVSTSEIPEAPRYLEGKVSGAVFNDEKDQDEMRVYSEVFKNFAWSNPLWPKLFPGVRKMEAEMSTGGTISILLACLAHRNRALKNGIHFPEMVIPSSAHAAFTKAAEVFRMRAVRVPVDPITFKVDVQKMKAAINSRTCMLVGSAPNFPFGTVDDITAIGELGILYDIPVHVDACLGGFILPFIDDTHPFDFGVPGYGLSPKGSSVVLYKNKQYLHNQYFCDADWQGGIYASATLEGSRSGLNIALCWASLLFQGWNKYKCHSEAVVAATKKIRDGWTSDTIDIHRLHDLIGKKGWQLTNLQFPSGSQQDKALVPVEGVVESLLADLRDAVAEIKANPKAELDEAAALYGMAEKIPDRTIIQEFAYSYLDACYSSP
ncbi:unnamed protein product [Nippostrongylus brasiliensis]|uniref:Sphingosine-1-phosphate lyase 1 (inferred by orthology to a human protein) n=1 Tax=Nippostrongylus brasiliensis TaxID=27835 RepID=A0A158QX55_NIPBR|nr:unnamed protein product [Nippostrongylus brasiliensis]